MMSIANNLHLQIYDYYEKNKMCNLIFTQLNHKNDRELWT